MSEASLKAAACPALLSQLAEQVHAPSQPGLPGQGIDRCFESGGMYQD